MEAFVTEKPFQRPFFIGTARAMVAVSSSIFGEAQGRKFS
jgi:hypothetical protein